MGYAAWLWSGDRQGKVERLAFIEHILFSIECLPWADSVLGAGKTTINKTHIFCSHGLYSDEGWSGKGRHEIRGLWSKLRFIGMEKYQDVGENIVIHFVWMSFSFFTLICIIHAIQGRGRKRKGEGGKCELKPFTL